MIVHAAAVARRVADESAVDHGGDAPVDAVYPAAPAGGAVADEAASDHERIRPPLAIYPSTAPCCRVLAERAADEDGVAPDVCHAPAADRHVPDDLAIPQERSVFLRERQRVIAVKAPARVGDVVGERAALDRRPAVQGIHAAAVAIEDVRGDLDLGPGSACDGEPFHDGAPRLAAGTRDHARVEAAGIDRRGAGAVGAAERDRLSKQVDRLVINARRHDDLVPAGRSGDRRLDGRVIPRHVDDVGGSSFSKADCQSRGGNVSQHGGASFATGPATRRPILTWRGADLNRRHPHFQTGGQAHENDPSASVRAVFRSR